VGLPRRVVLITGAAGAAGSAIARHLAPLWALHLVGRPGGSRPDAGLGTVHAVDVESPEQLARLSGELGPLDALIHTVGRFDHRPLNDVDPKVWRAVLSSNLDSAFSVSHAFRSNLRSGAGGRLVFFGLPSANAARAEPSVTPYFVAKLGLTALAQSLAVSEADHQVTCNIVAPSFLGNDAASQRRFAPESRCIKDSELCAAVDFLLAPSSAQVTGTTLQVSRGFRL
jgi:NAD(P)-dependent dehydrogenase (short-subunit alcohol dehydrogenase family)